MRIATFNLENLDDRPGQEPTLDARVKALAPMLERIDADILCLQEVNAQRRDAKGPRGFHALDRLLAGTRYADYARATTTNREGTGPADIHNLVILSTPPIAESRQIWHELVPEPRHRYVTARPPSDPRAREEAALAWDRPVLHARIALDGGQPLHLFNLHLRAPLACPVPGGKLGDFSWASVGAWAEGYYLSEIKRAGQALELRLAVERIFDAEPEAHVCLAGDFNAEEHHAPLDILRAEEDNTGNGALAPRVLVPVEHTLPPERRFTVIHQGRRQMLDHVLVSRPLMGHYRGSEIHNEDLADELVGYAAVEASPVSYHAPVVAVFDL